MARDLTNQELRAIREKCMGDERCIAREVAKASGKATADMVVQWNEEIERLEQKRIAPLLDFLKRDSEAGKPNRVLWSVAFAILQGLKDYNDLVKLATSTENPGGFQGDPSIVNKTLQFIETMTPGYLSRFPKDWQQWTIQSGLPIHVGPQWIDSSQPQVPQNTPMRQLNLPHGELRLK